MSGIGLIYSNYKNFLNENSINLLAYGNKKRGGEKFSQIRLKDAAAIFHRRDLTIIDKKSSFPYLCNKTDVLINFDGRIDNLNELKDKFGFEKNIPLEELILKIFLKANKGVFNALIGAFSLIIYDRKHSVVYAGRDHMGMKPLYYFQDNESIIFSSTISGIKDQLFYEKRINQSRLINYIHDFSSSNEETFFQNIFLIPKSSYIEFKNKQISINKYFEFNLSNEIKLSSDQEYAEATKELFFSTIANIKNSYTNYSAKLSGGLDSSSIVRTLISQSSNEIDLKCYSVLYNGISKEKLIKSDELTYMKDVINMGNAEHIGVNIDLKKQDLLASYQEAYETNDVVIPTYNRNLDFEIFKSMKKHGSNIIFDGFDGDSVISFGIEKFIVLLKNLKFLDLLQERKRFAKVHSLPFSYKTTLFFCLKNMFPNFYKLYKSSTISGINPTSETVKQSFTTNRLSSLSFQEIHMQILDTPSWAVALEFVEEDATINNVEEVYPFFDRRLMQYMISVPPNQKLNSGRSRFHFRNAMRGTIPTSVRKRFSKANLSPMWIDVVNKIPPCHIKSILIGTSSPLKNILNEVYVNNLIKLNSGDLGYSDSYRAQKISSLISLSLWMKKNHLFL